MNDDGTASYGGPTMLQIIISSVNPSTYIGVIDLKSTIGSTKLVQFQYNVADMCVNIMADYEIISEGGGAQ